jgi:hypothetical protein
MIFSSVKQFFPKHFMVTWRMYYAMRVCAVVLVLFLSVCIAAPVLAASEDRYGYIKIEEVQIQLDNGTAAIHVDYTVDEGTRFIFFLFGKQDLKNKLLKILNYNDAQIKRIDLSSADFVVQEAAYSYGNGIFWYPAHDFNIVIPSLSVRSPQAIKNFTQANQFPGGMGYFADGRPVPPPGEILPGDTPRPAP